MKNIERNKKESSSTSKNQGSKSPQPENTANHEIKEQTAIELINNGRANEAVPIYIELVKSGSKNPIVYGNLGALLKRRGDMKSAVTSLKMAIQLKPNYPEAHYNLGVTLQDNGDTTAAIASYKNALKFNPNHSEAHNNLGIALQENGDLIAAITCYKNALELKPNDPETHTNLGISLQEIGDLTTAIASHKNAIKINSYYPDAHNNLGIAFHASGNLTSAISSYKTALEIRPNYPEAQMNLSMAELMVGDYKKGWHRHEYRFQSKKHKENLSAKPSCERWNGKDITQDNKLILVSEQGLGDTLQFMRYASALKDKGLSISFCAQIKLHSIIKASGIDPSPLSPEQANQITEGQWTPLLSVPRHLAVSPNNPIITKPYIKTTEKLIAKWAGIIGKKKRPIVGINWQGNPQTEKTGLQGRSLELETFAPITSSSQISLLSLQKGHGSEQLKTCSFEDQFVSCQDQINDTWDFLETAAIIANCDLVITSDTSVAHLAGGMGKTTWLLLHKVPDWRWGLEGDTTFWYPSMRLFRQKERGNWSEVMERVADALQEYFGSSSTPPEKSTTPQPALMPEPTQVILAPISLGELIDKITILQIKTQNLQDVALENVKKELAALENTLNSLQLNIDPSLIQRLKEVNQDLWQIEDEIRDQERQKNFGETFIRLARSVYQQNDRRAAFKKEINTTYGSTFVEEKSYKQY